ncbi:MULTISPECIES: sugar nucleotide-binding protein [unclassified Mesobacillus]|uniref:sugar nucleotide-binding protein n=1 Tax=unclassified Mesobacillus TaxID=2675270 RepID=UPI00204264D6|nr:MULTISPECIES: sugar nucleotide-binding protein [unclassified Mesobacillus]MCM3124976.1 sugar nucleotide-binding protein [Mesobacillus sp. MER 33]MCM3235264.1 sugar nucleotide-binding protein [Mesobacillus sp. MER 48]
MLKNVRRKMKLLILGGKGFLGSSLMVTAHKKNITVYGTSRSVSNEVNILKTDIFDKSSILSVLTKTAPDIIVWTLMSSQNEIELINSGLQNLLSIIRKETKLIFISTDAVFTEGIGNYKETDRIGILPNESPLSAYVNAKYTGESLIKSHHKDHMIIRTGPIYGGSSNIEKRTARIIQKIANKESVNAATNLYRSFVHVDDLSTAILELIFIKFIGTIHLGPSKKVSYHTFYNRRLKQLGFNYSVNPFKIDKEDSSYISLDTSLNTQKANSLLKTEFREI